jgi:hypothetical protein
LRPFFDGDKMAQSEARLVIGRNPETRQQTGFGEATAANEAIAKQVKATRQRIHQQAKVDAAGGGGATEEPVPAPPREEIDSIEVPLRDGRVVEYGPPTGISLNDRIARLYSGRPLADGGPDPGITEYRLTRLLMGVRSINGKPPPTMTNLVERTRLANELGDQAIDLLFHFDQQHWPPLRASELPIIKKKLKP